MTGGLIQLPPELPGYMGNTPRMYFVVRQTTLVGFFRNTTTYTIVGFGGQNAYPSGIYIQDLIILNRFVPISNIDLIFRNAFEHTPGENRRHYIELLDTLQDNFNYIHQTRLDITDHIRWHVYREGEPCAAIAEGIPPP